MNFIIPFIPLIIPIIIYTIYTFGAFLSKDHTDILSTSKARLKNFPSISIVIPTHNEAPIITDRIANLIESYPPEKMEIIISDDGSTDQTPTIANHYLADHNITGKVITQKRQGPNKAINHGILYTSHEIIVITGADGLFDKTTIPALLTTLLSSHKIGAVTGDLIPITKKSTIFSNSEKSYRSIYGKMCTFESNIHSTYCFNGPVVAFKKSCAPPLNTRRGADDASLALSIVRNGYQTKYVPSAKFYEYAPSSFTEQRRQKIRRATRLIEATLFNLPKKINLFSLIIYPLRFTMFIIAPTLFLLSMLLWAIYFFTISPIFGFMFLFVITGLTLMKGIISTFIIYQFYLFIGLFNIFRDVHTWEPTERVKI